MELKNGPGLIKIVLIYIYMVNGPSWKQVISRTTYDMHTGKIIDHLVFTKFTSQEDLDRKLPDGVTWIKTVILFKVK